MTSLTRGGNFYSGGNDKIGPISNTQYKLHIYYIH